MSGNKRAKDHQVQWDRVAPLLVLLALLSLAWLGWKRDADAAHARIKGTDRLLASVVADRLAERLQERRRDVIDLRQARQTGALNDDAQFRQRVDGLRRAHPEFASILWVAPDGTVLLAHGARGSTALEGRNLRKDPRRKALLTQAASSGDVKLSEVQTLIGSEPGLALCAAVTLGGRLDGYILAGLSGPTLVEGCVPPGYRGSYNVYVRELGGIRLSGNAAPGADSGRQTSEAGDRRYLVDVWPARPVPASSAEFFTGLLFTALISAMFFLTLRERRKALSRAEDRKAALEALGVSEHRLADIVAKSPWVVIEHGLSGQIEGVNPAAERVYKRSREEMLNHSASEWTHQDDVPHTMELVRSAFSNQETPYFESRIIDSEGGVHYLRWTGTARYDNAGRVTGSVLFGLDITAELAAGRERERLLVEEQRLIERLWVLNDFARSLRTTLDMGSLFQIAIRAASNVLADKWCAILTYNPDTEMFSVATVWTSAPNAPQAPIISPGIRFRADATSLTEAVRECRQQVVDDLSLEDSRRERELAASGFLSRAAVPIMVDNVCIGVIVAYSGERAAHSRDSVEFMQGIAEHLALALTSSRLFSELKMAYNEVREAQAQVVQMEKLRAVGEMASGIAHDFNNSLAAVIGYTELLEEGERDPTRREQFGIVMKAAQDAATVVRRIQEYSRRIPESETFTRVDVNALASEAVALTRHKWRDQAHSRGVTLDVVLALEDDLPVVRGDSSELREVLTNLIFNAVDAMPKGGVIRVCTSRRGPTPIITVTDQGTGMSEEVKAHVFEPFFTTKGREGNGLGLSVSYGIVRRHGGDLQVESEPGEGATFTVILPPADTAPVQQEAVVSSARARRATALVIDDDPTVSGAVSALLQNLGNTVVTASSGEEGLLRLQEGSFDVLFTDLGMPGMNGREVAIAAKRLAPLTSVILLTGWGDHVRATEDAPQGVDLVLGKPVKLNQLRDALCRFCPADEEHEDGSGPIEAADAA